MDDEWIFIDVPDNDSMEVDEEFLADLDRYDDEALGSLNYEWESPLDILRPPNVDIDPKRLIEIIRRRRPVAIDKLRKKIKGRFPGGPGGLGLPSGVFLPPPDALAVYLPFHRYPDMWGIYLLDAGVASFATDIRYIVSKLGGSLNILDARKVAAIFLFHHEAYHSAVEAFSIRCELSLGKPIYRTGLRHLFTRAWSPGEPHEEILATAYGIRKVRANLSMPKHDQDMVVNALCKYMLDCPPPYPEGVQYLDEDKFDDLERKFMEQAMRRSPSKSLPPAAWTMGTYLMAPLLQRNRKYSWICSRADFRKKSKLSVHYFRQRDVLSCLQRLAGTVVEPGGRHQHVVREIQEAGNKKLLKAPIPSGEIHKGTLGSMLKQLGLDLNVETFRDECRKAGKSLS